MSIQFISDSSACEARLETEFQIHLRAAYEILAVVTVEATTQNQFRQQIFIIKANHCSRKIHYTAARRRSSASNQNEIKLIVLCANTI